MNDTERNRLLNNLSPQDKSEYNRLGGLIQKIGQQNPGLKVDALEDYRDTMLKAMVDTQYKLNSKIQEGQRKGQPFTPQQQQGFVNEKSLEARNEWMEKRLPKYGADGQKAWQAFRKETQKSVFSGVVSNVYDEEKGVKWGGVAGALLGGLLMMNMATGSGGLGFFGIAMMIIGAVAGSWLGNMAGDYMSNKMSGGKAPEGVSPEPGKGMVREMGSPEAEKRKENAMRMVRERLEPEKKQEDEPSHANLPSPTSTPVVKDKAAGKKPPGAGVTP